MKRWAVAGATWLAVLGAAVLVASAASGVDEGLGIGLLVVGLAVVLLRGGR